MPLGGMAAPLNSCPLQALRDTLLLCQIDDAKFFLSFAGLVPVQPSHMWPPYAVSTTVWVAHLHKLCLRCVANPAEWAA